MSTVTTQWIAEFVDNISSPVEGVTEAAQEAAEAVEEIGSAANGAADEIKKLSAMDLKAAADSIRDLTQQFEDVMAPGMSFEAKLKEVQSVTRQTDEELKKMGDSARDLAIKFGGDATDLLGSFGSIIASLGPAIAEDEDAMKSMGDSVSTLSKLMNNDAVGAMDALTTAMLQFGVDLSNPQEAAEEIVRMMNVMAAAGNEGASEVADTAAALKNAGIVARQAGLSFEETNAALQGLAQGGRVGAEAGVSLRNVLTSMAGIDILPRKAQVKLKELGVDFDIVSNKSLPFADRLRELKRILQDATLAEQIFGKENVAAAKILLETIDAQEEMTQVITGTNAAYESAEIVMSSQMEKMNRMNAWLDDLKISFFEVAGGITPFVVGLGVLAFTVANMAAAITGVRQLITFVKSLTIATNAQTGSQWRLNFAMLANPVGLIIVGIAALTAGVIYCWNKFEGFRTVIMGVFEAIKGFGNVIKDYVINRIKELISGVAGVGKALFSLFTGDFSGAWEAAKQAVIDISGYNSAKTAVVSVVKDYGVGAQKGSESWANDQNKKDVSPSSFVIYQETGKKTGEDVPPDADAILSGLGKNKDGKGDKDGVNLSGSGGGGGGKSVVMNVTNNFYVKETRELVEAVAKAINNRLSDSLAVVE